MSRAAVVGPAVSGSAGRQEAVDRQVPRARLVAGEQGGRGPDGGGAEGGVGRVRGREEARLPHHHSRTLVLQQAFITSAFFPLS